MWFIELLIIVYIIYRQLKIYAITKALLTKFQNVFPQETEETYTIESGDLVCQDSTSNEVRETILSSINTYLQNNRNSKADFYLIKDIVDRNCDSVEEEISTQVPVPLYYGLAGTMLGIILGVGSLWLSGDLSLLLDATAQSGDGSNGIENLLVGVAMAMVSSLVGVCLTTSCSLKVKEAKKEHEEGKHEFLSWIQAELLPVLTTDMMSAFSKMTDNLASFNDAFAQNANDLKESLSIIQDATKGQTELFETIRHIHFKEIVTANIAVYEKLKGCTEEIGLIGEQLKASRQYLQKVTTLTDKLDATEKRTQLVEEMANYFYKERSNIDALSGVVSRSIGEADSSLQRAADELKESIAEQYKQLSDHMNIQREKFEEVADEQTKTMTQAAQARIEVFDALSDNLNTVTKDLNSISAELSSLTGELKNFSTIKSGMDSLVMSIKSQNERIDKLVVTLNQRSASMTSRTVHVSTGSDGPLKKRYKSFSVYLSRLLRK